MTALLLASVLALQATPGPAPAPVAGDVPTDWGALAELPYVNVPRLRGSYVRFVVEEVRSGRCDIAPDADGTFRVRVPLVVQLSATGTVKRMVPAAIGCPTVEQYTVGLVQNLTRGNVRLASMQGDGWYRTAMNFTWK
ncbi:hypothetical protein [Sphingomonas aracearum]|uniref:Uncharacterized protein n=1 Tax=Sphingomonas aracearum TaxID=2283317 RepID=A0A369VYD0_9SPHN|nr:hypothetical protein [Sphingomonas aracearum]RDE06839.1 hypothetical protein DVW87_03940 [Sphingomonas aracearum]